MIDKVALVIGGGEKVWDEYKAALQLCIDCGADTAIFACNDMIEHFPHEIDYACTLHIEKLSYWLPKRRAANFPEPKAIWAHRAGTNVSNWTRDWGGSCGLFATKVAREQAFKKVLLCGVPMEVHENHFNRPGKRWDPALAFRRGWVAHMRQLPPKCIRSMSGWTQQNFGAPDAAWLLTPLDDIGPLRHTAPSIKA